MSVEGVIFEVREFCLHDGPGIRTNVFFKGCPLRCAWCHNPEGLSSAPQLWINPAACTHCGACRSVCPLQHGDQGTLALRRGHKGPLFRKTLRRFPSGGMHRVRRLRDVCPQGCRRLCGAA
jgi:pyruvate formate lyase activating enzyme